MSIISVQDIQRGIPTFLRRIEAGESFLVVNGAHPLAEVRPLAGSLISKESKVTSVQV